jgi:hypothetical protein
MPNRSIGLTCALLLSLAAGCGGEPEPAAVQPETSSGQEQAAAPRRGMEVEGLMGTIPERKVQAALEPKLGAFQRCFAHGAAQLDMIAGGMQFYFRVDHDGRVEWVYPRASSIGHRPTEQCLLSAAQSTRFPEPKGGDAAEVSWSFDIDVAEDVRPPVEWDASQLDEVRTAQGSTLEACGLPAGALTVTAYVAPGGSVLAAGGSASSREAAEQIDCALTAISAWPMPDPGSYAAKVSFSVP